VLVDITLSAVPPGDAGAASGVTNTVMQVGGAAGLALLGTLFVVLLQAAGVAARPAPSTPPWSGPSAMPPGRSRSGSC
jgi:hypothetical protein